MTQSIDFAIYTKFFISLFALINPVGILPVFISLTNDQPRYISNKINLTAAVSVSIILWVSLFFGEHILRLFGISIDSFRIAGGMLLAAIAMTMVSGKIGEHKQNSEEKIEAAQRGNVGVVPLALPLLAGPGAISSTIVWGSRYASWSYLLGFAVAIAIFSFCCWALFRSAPYFMKVMGQTGINIITRIMGLILMALAVEFIASGIRNLFPVLAQIKP